MVRSKEHEHQIQRSVGPTSQLVATKVQGKKAPCMFEGCDARGTERVTVEIGVDGDTFDLVSAMCAKHVSEVTIAMSAGVLELSV